MPSKKKEGLSPKALSQKAVRARKAQKNREKKENGKLRGLIEKALRPGISSVLRICIAAMKIAAEDGRNEARVLCHGGYGTDRRTYYFRILRLTAEIAGENLRKEGYKVEVRETTHNPRGSDSIFEEVRHDYDIEIVLRF